MVSSSAGSSMASSAGSSTGGSSDFTVACSESVVFDGSSAGFSLGEFCVSVESCSGVLDESSFGIFSGLGVFDDSSFSSGVTLVLV